MQATKIRAGMVLVFEGNLCRVLSIMHVMQGNKRSKIQTTMRRLKDGIKFENRFRADENAEKADLSQKEMEFIFQEGDHFTFMDTETFEQVILSADLIGEGKYFLQPNALVNVQMWEDQPVGIDLPETVTCKVKETEPAMKGATASASYKPAKLDNGLTIKVPPFVATGDSIIVDTSSMEYLERA